MKNLHFLMSTAYLLPAILLILMTVSSSAQRNFMFSGDTLFAGDRLTWNSYQFIMQGDCNLVIYDSGNPVWATHTYNRGYNCKLRMQDDANLVIYDGNDRVIWASDTARAKGYYLAMLQPNRVVAIYGSAMWGTGSARVGAGANLDGNSTEPIVVFNGEIHGERNNTAKKASS